MLNVMPLDLEKTEGDAPRRLLGFVRDEGTRAALASALAADWPVATIKLGGIEDAIIHLAGDPSARVVAVDLTGCVDIPRALDRLAEMCRPGTTVIALGEVNDVNLYRNLRAAGVADYLIKPVTSEAFAAALEATFRPAAPLALEKATPAGEVIAVIGARGGVGVTSIATSLAWLLAEEAGHRTMLIDLDLYNGTTALALDVEPTHGLVEALANPDRIDALFLSSAAARVGGRLSLLAAEEPLDNRVELRPGALELLLKEACRDCTRVVLDVPHGDPELLRRAVAAAGVAVIVMDFSLAGLRDAGRLVNFVKETASQARRLVIGNRAGVSKKSALGQAEIEKTLGTPLAAIIREDAVVPQALNTGKVLPKIGKHSKAVASLRQLARSCTTEKPNPPSLFARLIGRGLTINSVMGAARRAKVA